MITISPSKSLGLDLTVHGLYRARSVTRRVVYSKWPSFQNEAAELWSRVWEAFYVQGSSLHNAVLYELRDIQTHLWITHSVTTCTVTAHLFTHLQHQELSRVCFLQVFEAWNNDMADKTFSPADYVVFVLVLVVSASIGIFYGCFGENF